MKNKIFHTQDLCLRTNLRCAKDSARKEIKMQKVVEFLQKNPVQYLATVGRDGKAKCRPFMFCFEQDESFGSVLTTQRMFRRIC